jgi:hypothetical protein
MRCYITEVVRRAPKETDARPTRHKCGCASLDRSECFALLCFARCFASRVALPARTSARLPALAAWPHKSLPQAIGACAVQYGAEASRRGGAVDNEHKQGCNARREWPPPCRHARAWHSEGAVQTCIGQVMLNTSIACRSRYRSSVSSAAKFGAEASALLSAHWPGANLPLAAPSKESRRCVRPAACRQT